MNFLADWKLWLSIGFCGLVAVSAFYTHDAIQARQDAVSIANETVVLQKQVARTTAKRVDDLGTLIETLNRQLIEVTETKEKLETEVQQLRLEIIELRDLIDRGGDEL